MNFFQTCSVHDVVSDVAPSFTFAIEKGLFIYRNHWSALKANYLEFTFQSNLNQVGWFTFDGTMISSVEVSIFAFERQGSKISNVPLYEYTMQRKFHGQLKPFELSSESPNHSVKRVMFSRSSKNSEFFLEIRVNASINDRKKTLMLIETMPIVTLAGSRRLYKDLPRAIERSKTNPSEITIKIPNYAPSSPSSPLSTLYSSPVLDSLQELQPASDFIEITQWMNKCF
jgi:hypothetical protein